MVKFYDSIPPDLAAWALKQPVYFVASAPSTGIHVNVSPKGMPSTSLAILTPNQIAYIDATGSGAETTSHIRENGRLTMMFCSFDTAPVILRFYCRGGEVVEFNEPAFQPWLDRMGFGDGSHVRGPRAIVHAHVFKVSTSCGYGVPRLALRSDPQNTDEVPKPYLEERETHHNMTCKVEAQGKLLEYRQKHNAFSLDGLPGMKDAMKRSGHSTLGIQTRIWLSQNRKILEAFGLIAIGMGLGVVMITAKEWKNGRMEGNSYFSR